MHLLQLKGLNYLISLWFSIKVPEKIGDSLMQVNSLSEEQRKDLESQLKEFTQEMTRLKRINRSWDAGLTITTIILTLAITTLTTLEPIDEQAKKITTGILGGVIVAIQSIGNAFPVKQRAGSYRLLQAQAKNLLSDVKYLENTDELKNIESQFYELNKEAAKIEVQ
ncbi:MAG TPA: hypothetical protein DCL61_06865 [Cyanobacteria bacterium UBA12227]|nr:hypothetical protein [Cyanobacteria bacterium UBA12227]HAX86377.1 hypothetical protein [Cyanobacteria bacterium UBA11370]HBY77032.1 hypothetical protein [Cyanobacteria bacterium UBA11148]